MAKVKRKRKLHEAALEEADSYKRKSKPPWFVRWKERHPVLAEEILDLVEKWKGDYELQQAYPNKGRLARFIADIPEVDVGHEIVRKQAFFDE